MLLSIGHKGKFMWQHKTKFKCQTCNQQKLEKAIDIKCESKFKFQGSTLRIISYNHF